MDVQHVSVSQMLRESIAKAVEPPPAGEVAQAPAGDAEAAGEAAGEASEASEAPESEAPAAASERIKSDINSASSSAAPAADLPKRLEKLAAASNKLIAERQRFAAERKQYDKDLADLQKWREVIHNAKQDPASLAELAGIEPDQYATLLLDRGALSPERKRLVALDQEVRTLRSEREKERQEQAQMTVQAQRNAVLQQVQEFTRAKPDDYEMINAWGQHGAVLQEIEGHYQQTIDPDTGVGEVMSYEDAAARVEARLVDNYLNPILKSNRLKKSQESKLGESAQAGTATSDSASASSSAPRKATGTITSKMRAGASAAAKEELSEAERYQKVGEFLLGQMMGRR